MSRRFQFKKTVFENGLTLVSERHPEFRSLSVGVWVKVGTRHEKPRDAGLSHVLEHMLFKGTQNRNALEIAKAIDQIGGEFNAFTTREYTCFHTLTLSKDLGLCIDILIDILLNSNFESDEFEREKKVILQEVSMVGESPEELIHDYFFELIYGKHGLGSPILGTETSIRRVQRRNLLTFFRKHYRPDHIVIAVAGDIEHQALTRKLRPLAKSGWPGRQAGKVSRREMGFEPAPKIRPGCWWVTRQTEQVHLVWGVEAMNYTSADRFPAYLLDAYLGGGMSSQLFQEIREKNGLAYTVYSSLSLFMDSGVFSVYAGASMAKVPLCVKLIEDCVARLKNQLLSVEELDMIKSSVKGGLLLSSDDVESRMSGIAGNEILLGKHVALDEVCKIIDAVTPQELRRVARKLFKSEKRSLVLLGPKPSKQVKAKLKPIMSAK